jgi:molybdate transport repressor ModE-like protein
MGLAKSGPFLFLSKGDEVGKIGVPSVKIVIYPPNGKPGRSRHGGFCKGAYQLLRGIEDTGSLKHAADGLGMSYSKAWSLIKEIENDFGKQIVVGHVPRGSEITRFGQGLLDAYEVLLQEASLVGIRGRGI